MIVAVTAVLAAAVVALGWRNSKPRREPPPTWHKRPHE